ncbi:hypothetical protein OH799_18650 [Nocardia sp. NBC_00881]|uniref:hypothetical protein n=1 Tax=Nocardia sp. NBC_00881 TaxID=2975995 RepID=UPI0038640E70|nr:hypothetical protein OH799_18650 [Nocardia sp. NBC_00881]
MGELVGWQVLREGTIHLVPYGWAGHAVGYAAEHGGLPGVTAVTFMGTTAGPATDRGGLAGLHLSVASKQGVPRSVSPKPTGVDPRKLGADKIDGDPQQLARITVGELPPAGQKRGGPEALPASSGTDEGLRQGSSIDDRPMEPDDGVADYRSPDEPRPNSVVRSDGIVSESRVESSTPAGAATPVPAVGVGAVQRPDAGAVDDGERTDASPERDPDVPRGRMDPNSTAKSTHSSESAVNSFARDTNHEAALQVLEDRGAVSDVYRKTYEDLIAERAEVAAELARIAGNRDADLETLKSEGYERKRGASLRGLQEQGVINGDRGDTDLRAAKIRYREVAAMVGRLEEFGAVSKDATPWRHGLLERHARAVLYRGEALRVLREAAEAAGADLVALQSAARAETELEMLKGRIPDRAYQELFSALSEFSRRYFFLFLEKEIAAHDAVVESRVATVDPSESGAVRRIQSLSADRPAATVAFNWGEGRAVEAAALALGDKLREWGWRDQDRIAAAMEVVRNAGLDALRFVTDFPAPEELGQYMNSEARYRTFESARPGRSPEYVTVRDLVSSPRVQLTLRLSEDADVRSLHVSVECNQLRPLGPLLYESFAKTVELVPQHSANAVGAEVYRSLQAAARSGVEPHGESGRISKSRASWTNRCGVPSTAARRWSHRTI